MTTVLRQPLFIMSATCSENALPGIRSVTEGGGKGRRERQRERRRGEGEEDKETVIHSLGG